MESVYEPPAIYRVDERNRCGRMTNEKRRRHAEQAPARRIYPYYAKIGGIEEEKGGDPIGRYTPIVFGHFGVRINIALPHDECNLLGLPRIVLAKLLERFNRHVGCGSRYGWRDEMHDLPSVAPKPLRLSADSVGGGAYPISEQQACRIPVCSTQPSGCDIRLLRGGRRFLPQFCPHRRCRHHRRGVGLWYIHWGSYHNSCFGRIQRFRCRGCGGSFSEMSFSADIYIKRRACYRRLHSVLCDGAGVRAAARRLECSTGTVANRLQRSARAAFATLARLSPLLAHHESLALDGFRSFCRSQHAPCDLTHLIGRDSEYVYAFDYAPLRRGGRMSEAQRRARARFEAHLRAAPEATEESARRLYDALLASADFRPNAAQREIWSDEHPGYERAWNAHPHLLHAQTRGWITRRTVSSRRARNQHNPLRAVNYFDRQLRKDLAEHHRESVCHARSVTAMIARFALYAVHHNTEKPRRIRGSRTPPAAERVCTSHAVAAGAPAKAVARLMLWRVTCRPFLSRERLGEFAELWWRGQIPTPPEGRLPALPQYALA